MLLAMDNKAKYDLIQLKSDNWSGLGSNHSAEKTLVKGEEGRQVGYILLNV